MSILEIKEAQNRYPHLGVEVCDDPRHDSVDDEAVAVIETRTDVYPVCEGCLESIKSSRA